jgi:hypothetical protein
MSFFESITKKSRLKAAIKQVAEARNSDGGKADQLFKTVYQEFAEVVSNEPVIAEALYNWGFALLHQARTKPGDQAAKLYQDAIAKFSFCLTIEPTYLGAAIDGGVAYMELARVKAVGAHDSLYGRAKNYFEKANAIQAGSASYNLACIYGLRGDKEACLTELEISKGKGSLPSVVDILADPDLETVKYQDWFIEFMESLEKEPEPVALIAVAKTADEDSKVDDGIQDTTDAEVESAPANEKTEAEADQEEVAAEAAIELTEESSEEDTAAMTVDGDEPVSEKTEASAETEQAPAEEVKSLTA